MTEKRVHPQLAQADLIHPFDGIELALYEPDLRAAAWRRLLTALLAGCAVVAERCHATRHDSRTLPGA
jgi:hypothetical protein